MQNVEVLNESGATKVVATCAHCFNTLKNEHSQLGGRYEVLHHTQLLNRLVREGRLTPVAPVTPEPAATPVTHHDPCYIGRHNGVHDSPRELIGALPGLAQTEMPRHGNRSFCCGAGGARTWMEEKLGTRINDNRMEEALATGTEQVAVACPSAASCSATASRRSRRTGRRARASRSWTSRRCCWPPSAGVIRQANRRTSEDFLVLVVDPGPGCTTEGCRAGQAGPYPGQELPA